MNTHVPRSGHTLRIRLWLLPAVVCGLLLVGCSDSSKGSSGPTGDDGGDGGQPFSTAIAARVVDALQPSPASTASVVNGEDGGPVARARGVVPFHAGRTASFVVVAPVRYSDDCAFPVAGVVQIDAGGPAPVTLDLGDGRCDDYARLKVAGDTQVVRVPRRR